MLGQKEILFLGIGLGAGYYIAKLKLENDFFERLEKETEDARNHYRDLYDRKTSETTVSLEGFQGKVAEAAEALVKYQGIAEDPDVADSLATSEEYPVEDQTLPPYIQADIDYSEAVRSQDVNLSTPEEDAEDKGMVYSPLQTVKDEEAEIDTDFPYHISQETFYDDGQDKQYTITWYEGDQILAGQSDKEIPDNTIEMTIGRKHLQMFGQKAEDENTVYVRNEAMGADFEIVRDHRTYREVILGEK